MRNVTGIIFIYGFAASLAAQTPSFTAATVVNAGGLTAGPIAPRELVEVDGTGLGPAARTSCGAAFPLPASCGGTSALVNGKAAPMVSASATQITFEAPVDLSGSSATLQVTTQSNGQTLQSAVVTVPVAAIAPGVFTVTQDNLTTGEFVRTTGGSVILASNPALPGDVLTVYGTGFGQTNPVGTSGSIAPAGAQFLAPVAITVAGLAANIIAAGPSSSGPALDQVNFTVPLAITAGNLPVVVTVGGKAAPSVLLPIVLKPVITGVSNNASGAAGIESGSWISIYGGGLSASTRIWQASDFSGSNLPLTLDGVSVKVNGKTAAVYYISPVQLNVQAPADATTGPVQVEVTNSYGVGDGTATLQPYGPGFYTSLAPYAAAVHSDGVYVAPVGYFGSSVASRPAQPGEIVEIFGTGFGPTNPTVAPGQIVSAAAPLSDVSQLQLTIGGVPAAVQFAGIVAAGEYQLNVTLPQLANGDQPIIATIGGVSSQTGLAIPIKN
jgi:uncharacterized protein (TIGR03437 family)